MDTPKQTNNNNNNGWNRETQNVLSGLNYPKISEPVYLPVKCTGSAYIKEKHTQPVPRKSTLFTTWFFIYIHQVLPLLHSSPFPPATTGKKTHFHLLEPFFPGKKKRRRREGEKGGVYPSFPILHNTLWIPSLHHIYTRINVSLSHSFHPLFCSSSRNNNDYNITEEQRRIIRE